MTIFRFGAYVTVSAYTEVEADSLEKALVIAENREVRIGGNGSGNFADDCWLIEDADGAPQNISLEGEDNG